MAKAADIYFITDPWKIIEKDFNKEYGCVAESVFSLANEYMGIRGYFEEGYSGEKLIGSYFNGIYEQEKQNKSGYKGITDQTEFMVNSVDWLYTRIVIDGEVLDLGTSHIENFERFVDMRDGVLTRSFTVITTKGKRIRFSFERFLSMSSYDTGCQKISIESIDFKGTVWLVLGMDFSNKHMMYGKNYWSCKSAKFNVNLAELTGETDNLHKKITSTCIFNVDGKRVENVEADKLAAIEYSIDLNQGERKTATRLCINTICKDINNDKDEEAYIRNFDSVSERLEKFSYDELKRENAIWWENAWEKSDIAIDGDEINQQGIRFCIFQMLQTYHGVGEGNNIGAKGLTGEAYNGNAFWDTETYGLPFYLFNNEEAAKNLLMFRYMTLPEAKFRSEQLDCKGAFYPIATISGRECCNLWQHASLQLQASTAVAYGIWLYEKITGKTDFLVKYGIEELVEICRMLATRGDYSADGNRYGYYCVMGPDEFQMMVNNNCYTNYMAKFSFEYTLDSLHRLKEKDLEAYKEIIFKSNLSEQEMNEWHKMAKLMYIPYDEKRKLYEQHEGFFSLPHVDISKIPVEQFPLYSHWSYDHIYRNDMIKQPDVLMFMLMFNSRFSNDELKANYEFYEPKCIHESSLSPSVHSILATQLKKHKEAYNFFRFATRMDLDNYNRNSNEGLHVTSISAAWMNIIYGFGGMRSDGDILSFNPSIPEEWNSYSFRLMYRGHIIIAKTTKEHVYLSLKEKGNIEVMIYGKKYLLSEKETIVEQK